MTALLDTISYDNPVFRAYVFWSSILILKMLAMAYLTARQRKAKKVCKAGRSRSHVNYKCRGRSTEPIWIGKRPENR